MRFPMLTVLQATGEAATYTPPAGSPVACHVKRVGGGRVERFGSISVVVEDLTIHVAQEQVTPAVGGIIDIGGQQWTVEAVSPVENDPLGLLRACRVTWGVVVKWLRVSGSGSTQHPPQHGANFVATGAAGAATVNITTAPYPYVVGKLMAGDVLTIAGTDYQVTADVVAADNVFTAVPITPALAATVTDAPCEIDFGEDVRAAPADYEASEILGGVQTGDRRLIVQADEISGTPSTRDRVILDGEEWAVENVTGVYSGAVVAVWDVQIRK